MDLGIAGRWAVVCASSQGLGRACAEALIAEGVNVVVNARHAEAVESTATQLQASASGDAKVLAVAADITTDRGRADLLAACEQVDILVNNNAGPRPGRLAELDEADLRAAVESNYLAPLLLARAVIPGMRERRFGRVVNITSAMVTTPRPAMVGSAGARAALTAAMKAIALDVAADNVTVNNLLPERIDSPRQIQMAHYEMDRLGLTFEQAREAQAESIAAKRLGRLDEFGAACAFLCSAQASFISGMNMHLDGGSYPGLL